MSRQRPPLPTQLPFDYAVVGRPRSSQSRGSGYDDWRDAARAAVAEEIETRTSDRGYAPSVRPLRAVIVWLSAQPGSSDHPDVDNIVKPLLDALRGPLIDDDAQFQRVEVVRIDLNAVNLELPQTVLAAQDDPEYAKGELVWVWVNEADVPDGPEREWWK